MREVTRSRAPGLGAVLLSLAVLLTSCVHVPAAGGGDAHSDNPLAAGPWGVYQGGADDVYPTYQAATGTRKKLLAEVALRSRVRWFTSYLAPSDVAARVSDYVMDLQRQYQSRNVVVPLALFRQFPGHERNKGIPWTLADREAYRRWMDGAARGIGSAHAMVVLEPDLPVALKGWRPDIRLRLVDYAARTLGALPNAAVYLDGGAADWLAPGKAAAMLKRAGVAHVRGFALNGTHYDTTVRNIQHGRSVVAALARLGVPGRHFVIDTADNGQGFSWSQFHRKHPNGFFPNAPTCRTRTERHCVTSGIPPTTRVADPAWQLPNWAATVARHWVDGYVWYGRPYLTNGTWPFDMGRTLAIARTTPYP